jgi:hypothetical protein
MGITNETIEVLIKVEQRYALHRQYANKWLWASFHAFAQGMFLNLTPSANFPFLHHPIGDKTLTLREMRDGSLCRRRMLSYRTFCF